jgi:23S rRNA (cytidine1920-2'-O)/16S rRNA (cytidine1409-2'-O)-methyltransferase
MNKIRLDNLLVMRGLIQNRSKAENSIKLGEVLVEGRVITKPGYFVREDANVEVRSNGIYVSRAALKLKSVSEALGANFKDKTVLDVGSSTGGFTDFALQNGAKKVYAVELGTEQMDKTLRQNPKIELYEKTDIRDFTEKFEGKIQVDIVVIDVSFVSLRTILPSLFKVSNKSTKIYAMVKPQFEAVNSDLKHKGVIKNDKIRRQILKDFEVWAQSKFVIIDKADSKVAGAKGNLERFYHLKLKS